MGKSQDRLSRANTFAYDAFDAVPDGVLVVDSEGRIKRANPQAAELFGATVDELEALSVEDLMPSALRSAHQQHRNDFAANPRVRGMATGLDLVARRTDGSTFPVDIALSPLEVDDQPHVVVSIRNTVERRIAERELRLVQERLAILEDRERIARDLHDTVIQEVFASGLSLQALLARVDDNHVEERLRAVIERLDGSITRLRDVIFELHGVTEAGELDAAIAHVANGAAPDLGFDPIVTIDGDVDNVSPRVREHLIPTIREALANVAKHADADSVEIRLEIRDQIILTIIDDGKGLKGGHSPGFGFKTMTSRANGLGGTCYIAQSPTGGVQIIWTVPATEHGDQADT